jgi:hypothetical protein
MRGFVKIRRGLEEHLVSGQLGFLEAGVYLAIHLQANYETGVWVGSAPRLLATAPRGTNLREVQRAMQRLCQIGFVKVFHTHGKRGNFRALINRYEPQFGALTGMRLNAEASTSWQQPVYESCAEDALTPRSERADAVAEDGTEPAPIPEVEVEKTKKENKRGGGKTQRPVVLDAAAAAFRKFGFDSVFGHRKFQTAIIGRAQEINDTNLIEIMERVFQDCDNRVPPSFKDTKHNLERADRDSQAQRDAQVGSNGSGGEPRNQREEIQTFILKNAAQLDLVASKITAEPAKAAELDRITQELRQINVIDTDVEDVERTLSTLEERLFQVASENLSPHIRRVVELELATYRGKMKAEDLALVEKQCTQKHAFQAFGLPRLSLYYMAERL